MNAIDLEAARSLRSARPLVDRPHPWWPRREQIGLCWCLALVIAAELVVLALQIWRRI